MTATDARSGVPELHGRSVHLTLTSSGAPREARAFGLDLLLHPADELQDGLAGLWLRERGAAAVRAVHPLVGAGSAGTAVEWAAAGGEAGGSGPGEAGGSGPGATVGSGPGAAGGPRAEPMAIGRAGDAQGLHWRWTLRLLTDRAGWSWDVTVRNARDDRVELDLLHAQDLAFTGADALAANTLYPSQYLDLTPVDLAERGTALAVRQNMPGPTAPWGLVGCHTRAERWATDLLQLTGRGLPEGAPWPGLRADLPATRLQHEHAAALLQTTPVRLEPGAAWRTGFFVVLLPDHPGATSDADAAAAHGVDLPEPVGAEGGPEGEPGARRTHRPAGLHAAGPGGSLVAPGRAHLPVRAFTDAELARLAPGPRRHLLADGRRPLSWFDETGAHLVTAAHQRAVLRPHGQVLRALYTLEPGDVDVTSTVWMDGSFSSQLTAGHAALGRSLSLRPSPLGLGRVHGLRVAVDPGEGWVLLGTPALWRSATDSATWWYPVGERVVRVHAGAPDAAGRTRIEVETSGEPVPALVLLHLDWTGAPRLVGDVHTEPSPRGARITVCMPDPTGPRLTVEVDGCAPVDVGDDAPLFDDGRSRGEPVVSVRLPAAAHWTVTLTARAAEADALTARRATSWADAATAVRIAAAPGHEPAAADLLARLDTAAAWFAHDALIHYLSPRGLEQYTGGAWGTRDACQGPVGLLRSWAAHDAWRALMLRIFRAQHERGDWPQWFDFLAAHRTDRVADAHGDVVHWPILALGQYLEATGDQGILDERVAFTGDGAPGSTATVAEHVGRALDAIEATFLPGTALPAYGHGDWNDSMQPANPELARAMVSPWTVLLMVEALTRLAGGLTGDGAFAPRPAPAARARETAARARGLAAHATADLRAHFLPGGTLCGYGVRTTTPGIGFEPLIHPADRRTGLRYSLLPMVHAIAWDTLTPDEARHHLDLVARHLTGPDGARLFDRPVDYRGGPTTLFQRAEAAAYFGREVGIMYMHAHIRYAEALARVGDGPGLLRALARTVPIRPADLTPSAAPRQGNTYASSSDADFPDRYAAGAGYDGALAGTVPLEAGWRVYSSGPGLVLEVLTQRLIGVRHAGAYLHLDPVVDPALGTVTATVPTVRGPLHLRIQAGERGHGPVAVYTADREVPVRPLTNPYRAPGVAVAFADLAPSIAAGKEVTIRLD